MAFINRSRRGPLWLRLVLILIALGVLGYRRGYFDSFLGTQEVESGVATTATQAEATPDGSAEIERLFNGQGSGVMVEVSGKVQRTLEDDLEGSPHQRFVIELSNGRTLLISHNLDLAQRVPLQVGDEIQVRGEYEWNDQGGLLHWTHHDPEGQRTGGWILHAGSRYR